MLEAPPDSPRSVSSYSPLPATSRSYSLRFLNIGIRFWTPLIFSRRPTNRKYGRPPLGDSLPGLAETVSARFGRKYGMWTIGTRNPRSICFFRVKRLGEIKQSTCRSILGNKFVCRHSCGGLPPRIWQRVQLRVVHTSRSNFQSTCIGQTNQCSWVV